MKIMKKIVILACMVLALASCGNRNAKTADETAVVDSTVVAIDSLAVASDTVAVDSVATDIVK